MSQPRIGISGRLAMIEGAERSGVNGAYLRAVARAGGAPMVLSPLAGAAAVPALLDGVDALLLSGGADIDPVHYHTAPHPKLGTVEQERDTFELALFAEARRREMPVLAICRGLQLMNVALGGTLWQDLPAERAPHPQSRGRNDRVHPVTLTSGSRLFDLLGTTDHQVNSFHHQAIRDLAPGLTVTALAPDGVIEGVEMSEGGWCVGVQWHPEEFWGEATAADHALFEALINAGRTVRG